jgi:hypothetical protein
MLKEIEELKEHYFASVAVGIKLQGQVTEAWKTRDVSIPELYQATLISHPDWKTWADLLKNYLIIPTRPDPFGTTRLSHRALRPLPDVWLIAQRLEGRRNCDMMKKCGTKVCDMKAVLVPDKVRQAAPEVKVILEIGRLACQWLLQMDLARNHHNP